MLYTFAWFLTFSSIFGKHCTVMDLQKSLNTHEVSALSRGVQAVLRRLIRPLMGSISLARLQEMLRVVFIEVAEEHLSQEFPDRSPPVGQMALLTGLDSRQINRLRRSSKAGSNSRQSNARYQHSMTPTSLLLDKWSTDPELVDEESGQPRALTVFGEEASIEALMRSTSFIRGVTPRSVADRLILSGTVIEDDDGRLHMVTEMFLPSASSDFEGAIEAGFDAIERLVETVVTNLENPGAEVPRLYQRNFWTYRLAPHQQQALRERLEALLTECEGQGKAILADMEMKIESPSQVTAGFGLYYYEDQSRPGGS